VLPFLMVQARVSFGPQVKYVCNPNKEYVSFTNARRPHASSCTPKDSKNSFRSSKGNSTSSASTCAETMTTPAPSLAATSRTFSTNLLPVASSASPTLAA